MHTTDLDVLVAMELLSNGGQPPLQLLRIHLRGVRTRRHPGGWRRRHVSRPAVVSTGIVGRWVGGCPSSQHVPTHHNTQSITFPTNSKCTLQVTMSETKTKPTQTTNAKWTEQLWNSPSHNAFSKPSWQTNKQKLNTKIWFRKNKTKKLVFPVSLILLKSIKITKTDMCKASQSYHHAVLNTNKTQTWQFGQTQKMWSQLPSKLRAIIPGNN